MSIQREEKRDAFKVLIRYLQSEIDSMEAEDRKAPAPPPSREPLQSVPFLGRPMVSRHGGKCFVCAGPIQQNTAIIYRGVDKAVAHATCGCDDGGRR